MIHKIKILAVLAAAAISTTACLDKYPDDAILTEQAMNNIREADQVILGIYSKFKSSALYSGYLTVCPDIQADLVYAVDGYTNTYGNFWRWHDILATNPEIEAVYASLYSVIGSCNFFFDNVEKVRNTLTNDSDLDKLQVYEGEAHFARALAYSELIKMFCKAYDPQTAADELGVVLITKYYKPEPMVRSSLKQSYDLVLDDLEKAYEYLDNGTYADSNYFTRDVVCALYARVYLYMQDWDNAIKYSTEVIGNTDGFRLASATTMATTAQTEYQYMWTNDYSREIIWKVGFTTTSRGGALGQVFLNYDWVTYRPDYVPAKWALSLYSTSTDRRYSAFFRTIQTGHSHGLSCPLLIKYEGNESFRNVNILHTNMPKVFRLSEQYLIRAEAYCSKEDKDFTKAAKDITTLRVARYTNYGSATLSEDNWLQTISDERVRELYMEGFRLNDLKRWGKGFERTPQQNSVKAGSSLKIEAGDPLFVWPIPQHELDSPGAQIQPNESNK